jgi:phenylalanyl-tRNA synthetase alpha subunit
MSPTCLPVDAPNDTSTRTAEAHGGIDPSRWSGLAMGVGLDRVLMLRKGIDDIRLG